MSFQQVYFLDYEIYVAAAGVVAVVHLGSQTLGSVDGGGGQGKDSVMLLTLSRVSFCDLGGVNIWIGR